MPTKKRVSSVSTSALDPETTAEAGPERDRPATDAAAFGGRLLTADADVYQHNAWDHVDMSEEDKDAARARIAEHTAHMASSEVRDELVDAAASHWDAFYGVNANRFFKDRHWLPIEFPDLFAPPSTLAGTATVEEGKLVSPFTVLEIGCGTGATVYPLLAEWKRQANASAVPAAATAPATDATARPNIFIHASDFSSTAVRLVKTNPAFDPMHMNAFVYDLTSPDLPESVAPGSVDVLVLVFVFSALAPETWDQAMTNIHRLLRPGGLLLLRDYAQMDLAQIRMKNNRCIGESFYMRGDKTLVYFLTTDEMKALAAKHGFQVEQLGLDHRLLVNRQRQLRMHRNWLQAKFRKPLV